MAMELKILSPTPDGFVKQILWNADEISEEIEKKIGYYKTLVYTDTQVVEAKKDRATLNKFIAALKAKDREIKDLCLAPYEEFHARMLQIIKQVEEPAAIIDQQVKAFEEEQKRKKRSDIEALFAGKGFQPWVSLDKIWDPKWLNKTYSLKQIDEDLNKTMYKIGEDIFLINRQGAGVQAALSEYKRSLNVTDAVRAAQRYVEAKMAEEASAKATAPAPVIGIDETNEEIPGQTRLNDFMNPPEPEMNALARAIETTCPPDVPAVEPERKEIFFKVFVTREQLGMLNRFLKENGFVFRQIKNV